MQSYKFLTFVIFFVRTFCCKEILRDGGPLHATIVLFIDRKSFLSHERRFDFMHKSFDFYESIIQNSSLPYCQLVHNHKQIFFSSSKFRTLKYLRMEAMSYLVNSK